MNDLVERLVHVGYTPQHAEGVYNLYVKNNDLSSLESYVAGKEAMARSTQILREDKEGSK